MKARATQSGLHFFDRQSGLNVLMDEIQVPSALWAKAPRNVSIALTNACDLACPYCYAPKSQATLSFEQVINWATELDELGCIEVGFGGGEPTLVPGFASLCQELTRCTALAVQFTTHGHHLSPDMCKHLIGAVHFIRISIDGVGKTYEKFRRKPFSSVLHQLRLIKEIAPFGINCVVNVDSIRELDQVLEVAVEFGAQDLLLLPELATKSRAGFDPQCQSQLRTWIVSNMAAARIAISASACTDGLPKACPFQFDRDVDSYLHIDARGYLKRTSFVTSGILIGNKPIHSAIDALKETEEVMQ